MQLFIDRNWTEVVRTCDKDLDQSKEMPRNLLYAKTQTLVLAGIEGYIIIVTHAHECHLLGIINRPSNSSAPSDLDQEAGLPRHVRVITAQSRF